jgi:Orn/Lys/Arg decarboxylase, N-terminal domain
MSSRLTLLFVCDQSDVYSSLIDEFRAAEFQVLLARSLAQAKSTLLARSVCAIVLRHDGLCDDRALASSLKRMAPDIPVFLLTDQQQPLPADVDSIWRSAFGDPVITRGMAVFFRQLFNPRQSGLRPELVAGGVGSVLVGVTANGSQ